MKEVGEGVLVFALFLLLIVIIGQWITERIT